MTFSYVICLVFLEELCLRNFLPDCYSCQKLLTAQARLLSGAKQPNCGEKASLILEKVSRTRIVAEQRNSWKVVKLRGLLHD